MDNNTECIFPPEIKKAALYKKAGKTEVKEAVAPKQSHDDDSQEHKSDPIEPNFFAPGPPTVPDLQAFKIAGDCGVRDKDEEEEEQQNQESQASNDSKKVGKATHVQTQTHY
jgi:hypothetical protein